MNNIYLLPQKGQFHKANLHSHTTLSDGRWSPAQLKEEYQKRNYSVLAITDHNHYCYHKDLNTEDFVCIAATEINVSAPENSNNHIANRRGTYHFNFYDTKPEGRFSDFELPRIYEKDYYNIDAINEWLSKISDLGFLCCYNHPYWSLQDWRNYAGLKHLFAMEIYNHGCELDGLYGYAPQAYDEMLSAGQNIFPLSTDDNHNCHPIDSPMNDSFGGFTMIKSEELTYASIIEALQNGDFYASNGPQISQLYITDGKLVLECSEVEKIYLKSAGRRCQMELAQTGESIMEASFDLENVDQPFRLLIRDSKGRYAATRQYNINI